MPVNVKFDNPVSAQFGASLFTQNQQVVIGQAAQSGLTCTTNAGNPDATRVGNWFGALSAPQQQDLANGVAKMLDALSNRPITFSNATQVNPIINAGVGVAPIALPWTGQTVFGYVHSAGSHTGSGIRIALGQVFFTDATTQQTTAYKEKVQTILHELSHKVLGTLDVNWNGTSVYGVNLCQQLKNISPAWALRNADNWAYYLTSYVHTWP